MTNEVRRGETQADMKQVIQALARGPEGLVHDIAEFTGHLKAISESIDSLIREYPMLMMGEASVTIEFRMDDHLLCKIITGFKQKQKQKQKQEQEQ